MAFRLPVFTRPSAAAAALLSVLACSLIWGTTWYAITLQLGTVDPTASVAYRFAIAAAVMFAWCAATGRSLRLSRRQHLAVFAQGVLTFSIQYSMVYAAEQHVASAVVAVIFAALAFVNLVLFRLLLGQKAPALAWGGAALGVAGVAVLSAAELGRASFDPAAVGGLALAFAAMVIAAGGNLAAWKAQQEGAPVLPATGWAMAYGAALVALWGLVTGVEWRIEATAQYLGSLLYLAVFGSVVAFGLYFSLARSRGYALASYISALTPPVAMVVSVLFEGARFGLAALAGLALVLSGQLLLIRAR